MLSQEEFNHNVKEIKNCREKIYLVSILNDRLKDLRDQLEEPVASEIPTSLIRGGILQIRELLDLFE